MSSNIVYSSDTLQVRSVPGEDRTRWMVTFDNYGHPAGFERPGFGENFFASRGVSVVAVLGRGNDWYQYPDTLAALAAARAVVAGAKRIVTYGSSMGAYAAIRFADAVGAHACLALSPQYSNDPIKVPFEKRWEQEARALDWRPELDGRISCSSVPVIVYDSRNEDALHVALIAEATPVVAVPVPFSAHPATTYLNSLGMLENAVLGMLDGTLDVAALAREIGSRRRTSIIYLGELARRQPPWRPRLGIALARRALEISPDSDLLLHTLAKRLTEAGEHEEALPLHARAVELSKGHIGYSLPYSMAMAAAGDIPGAMVLAEELARSHPEYAQMHAWVASLYWRSDRHGEARHAISVARRMAPGNPHYLSAMMLYRAGAPGRALAMRALRAWRTLPDRIRLPLETMFGPFWRKISRN